MRGWHRSREHWREAESIKEITNDAPELGSAFGLTPEGPLEVSQAFIVNVHIIAGLEPRDRGFTADPRFQPCLVRFPQTLHTTTPPARMIEEVKICCRMKNFGEASALSSDAVNDRLSTVSSPYSWAVLVPRHAPPRPPAPPAEHRSRFRSHGS